MNKLKADAKEFAGKLILNDDQKSQSATKYVLNSIKIILKKIIRCLI